MAAPAAAPKAEPIGPPKDGAPAKPMPEKPMQGSLPMDVSPVGSELPY